MTALKSIIARLPSWWSDHAYQSMQFQVIDPKTDKPVYTIYVGSWNLQDQCVSLATNITKYNKNFKNNPFDYDEDDFSYETRKRAQIVKIIQKLIEGDDIVFLQEVDFLTKNGPLYNKLRDEFDIALRNLGYNWVKTKFPANNAPAQQRFVTVYNARKLSLIDQARESPRGALLTQNQYRAFETTFRIHDQGPLNGTSIVTTNVHLRALFDYKDDIEDYQKQMEARGAFHIMGGDTNNIQNEHLSTSLGHWERATNFSQSELNHSKLTVNHSQGRKKAYDRFFMVAPKDYCLVAKTALRRCEYVEIINDDPVFKFNLDHHEYRTRIGERWRRGKHILQELETKFSTCKNEIQQRAILNELWNVILIKNFVDSWEQKIRNPHLINALKEFIEIYDNAEIQFDQLLEQITTRQLEFAKAKETAASDASIVLHRTLREASNQYFKSNHDAPAFENFKATCDIEIKTARNTLQHHRGWKDFVAKVALTIICVLIPIGLAIRSRVVTGHWNFRLFETNSSKRLDRIEECINTMAPSIL